MGIGTLDKKNDHKNIKKNEHKWHKIAKFENQFKPLAHRYYLL